MPKVEIARRGENNQSLNITQTKIITNDVSSNKVTKQKIKELVFNYIVNEMCPLITCEKKTFRELIIGLTGLKDTSMIPDRRQIRSHLKYTYVAYVAMLTDLLKKHKYICTTADIWSTNNKSYMGMTCHLCMLENYPIVKQVFLKHNTTIPSSVPVERLFSEAIQVLTPRKNGLSDKTFEMLLCCKSNNN
ncbi:uncharacterized protein LOC112598320 [Melanaphis sacchari]|uniref:uncharacterized protein LOC112598320 n=1 Tax=Melanaphis sacchari TaxID=742174 RepID=UPI000DC14B67|nr:uncharacterized protein LOC112598320 [Melanaphis sacchari]